MYCLWQSSYSPPHLGEGEIPNVLAGPIFILCDASIIFSSLFSLLFLSSGGGVGRGGR